MSERDDDVTGRMRESFPGPKDVFSEGTTIDNRFRIIGRLSQGARGQVYVAEHTFLEEKLAIRILHDTEEEPGSDLEDRFMEEAKNLAKLNHRNIVKLFDVGVTSSGYLFATMELLKGETLEQWLSVNASPLGETDDESVFETLLTYLRQVADGLTEAHENGIYHLNLKPSNVFLNEVEKDDGRHVTTPKLIDFGRLSRKKATSKTRGEETYSAPEVKEGARGDVRADVFSFGALLYASLIGEPLTAAVSEDGAAILPISEINPAVPPEMDSVLSKAMSEKADDRYDTIVDLLKAFESALSQTADISVTDAMAGPVEPDRDPRILKLGVGLMVFLVLGLVIVGAALFNRLADDNTPKTDATMTVASSSTIVSKTVSETKEAAKEALLDQSPPELDVVAKRVQPALGPDAGKPSETVVENDEHRDTAETDTETAYNELDEEDANQGHLNKNGLSRRERAKIRGYIRQAKAALRDRRWGDAKKPLEAVLAINPSRADAWIGLGRIAFKFKSYDTAVDHVKQALSLRDRASWRLLYGEYLYKNGDKASAVKAWQAVISQYPSVRSETRYKAARFLRKAGAGSHQ